MNIKMFVRELLSDYRFIPLLQNLPAVFFISVIIIISTG
jgi:hypothetical protein